MFQMPSTKSSISFAYFIRSKKLGSKYCILKNEVVCSDSLRANSLAKQPQLHSCCGETFSNWKEVTEMGGFCWSKNELITSSKFERIWERLCSSLPHVWNAARWMHFSNPKFLKFWVTMLSPQVKYHFLLANAVLKLFVASWVVRF